MEELAGVEAGAGSMGVGFFSARRPGCLPSFLIEEYEQHCTGLSEDPEFHTLDWNSWG